MKIIDLSVPLENGMTVYPGDPEVIIEQIHTLSKEGWRLRYLQFASHVGTHVDAPAHMDENGATLDQIPIECFIGKTMLVTTGDKFPTNKGLAFKDGKLDIELITKLEAAKPLFVVVGNNAELSVELERMLLKKGIITITDLINMDELPQTKEFTFFGVPLRIKKGDGSPVRAFATLG